MKTNITTFALMAVITSSALAALKAPMPEFKNEKQLAGWRATKAEQSTSQGYAKEEPAFYTGKPYLASSGSYAFKYRSYDPEMARWTSEDPSGFPDGANQLKYAPSPTSAIDYEGLKAQQVFANQTQSISLSIYVYDTSNLINNYLMNVWKSAVDAAWSFSGTDKSNQLGLSMNTNISFTLQSGGSFNSNWASSYDNVVTFSSASNVFSQVFGGNTGKWRTDIGVDTVVHEVGHFMLATDKYTVSNSNGLRITTPIDGWNGTIMGSGASKASKKDANLVLQSLGEQTHLFE